MSLSHFCFILNVCRCNIYNNKLYFRCVKKSMSWINMEDFEHNIQIPYLETPCNFYREVNKKCNYFNN